MTSQLSHDRKMGSKKVVHAAQKFREGHSQVAYHPRGTISAGMDTPEGGQQDQGGIYNHCQSLLYLRNIFNSFLHTGRELKCQRTGYPKPGDALYRDIKRQN